MISPPEKSRGYASRHLRKSALKTGSKSRRRRRPTNTNTAVDNNDDAHDDNSLRFSTSANDIIQMHVPAVRLSQVLKRQPSLFSSKTKSGGKIHAANKHVQVVDRLAERYAAARVIYLGGNNLKSVRGFEQFHQLVTLSLSNNLLSDVQDLYVLAGACPTLRNLSLEGNTITHTPYYRERVIAAMPELEMLDSKKVTDDELRDAVTVEAKYAKSMELLFQNDCLIHKLKRTSHQIQLHSDFHSVRSGLRRGSIGSKIPVTILRKADHLHANDGSSSGSLSIDQFLHRWRYMDTMSPQERADVEKRIINGAFRFYNLLLQTCRVGGGGSGGGGGEKQKSNSAATKTINLWGEAFGQMLMVQQSSIAKLVDMCHATEEKAKTLVLKSAKKDSKGYLQNELQQVARRKAQRAEERERDLLARIDDLEKTVSASSSSAAISAASVASATRLPSALSSRFVPLNFSEQLNVSDLNNTMSSSFTMNDVSRTAPLEAPLEAPPPIGLRSEENVARTLAGSFENVSRHQTNIDDTLRASALAPTLAPTSRVVASSSSTTTSSREQQQQQSTISPAPRTLPPPAPTPRAPPAFSMSALPTPHANGGNSVVHVSRGRETSPARSSSRSSRRSPSQKSQKSNRSNRFVHGSKEEEEGGEGRRRRRRGPNFSVSPPPSASRSPHVWKRQQEQFQSIHRSLSPGSRSSSTGGDHGGDHGGEPRVSFSFTAPISSPKDCARSPRSFSSSSSFHRRRQRSSRSMSPERLPSSNTYRLVVRQLLQAVQHGRSLYGRRITKISEFFDAMDQDGNGMVNRDEFHRSLRRLGIGITNEQVDGIMAVVDEDHSGRLDKREFMDALRLEIREEKRGNLPYPSPQREIEKRDYNHNDLLNRSHVHSRVEAAKMGGMMPLSLGAATNTSNVVRWMEPTERRPKPESPWKDTLRRQNPLKENPIIHSPERRERSRVLVQEAHQQQQNRREQEQTLKLTSKLRQANDRIVQYHDLIDGMLLRKSTRPTHGQSSSVSVEQGGGGGGGGHVPNPPLMSAQEIHSRKRRGTRDIAATLTAWWSRCLQSRVAGSFQKWVMSMMFERTCSAARRRRRRETRRRMLLLWKVHVERRRGTRKEEHRAEHRCENHSLRSLGSNSRSNSRAASPSFSAEAAREAASELRSQHHGRNFNRTLPIVSQSNTSFQNYAKEKEEEEMGEKEKIAAQENVFRYRVELNRWKKRRASSLRNNILGRLIRSTFSTWFIQSRERTRTKWFEETRSHLQNARAGSFV